MTPKLLLSLDLSTTATGWAVFNIETKELLTYGALKPKVAGLTKMKYPLQQLKKIQNMVSQIQELISQYSNIQAIVIEEVNRHMNRVAGKTLDSLHGLLWDRIESQIHLITYIDSDGREGWRTRLKLKLSEADKENNKDRKKTNKKIAKGQTKLPIINKKHLACRFVNKKFNLNFDVDLNATDNDVVDAIGLGWAAMLISK